jgi:hypothetical protein
MTALQFQTCLRILAARCARVVHEFLSQSFRLGLYPGHETLAAPKLDRRVSDQLFGPTDRVAILIAGARFTVAEMSVIPDSIGSVVCHCLTSVATIPATIPIR